MSDISNETINAFLATEYRAPLSGVVVAMHIDRACPEMAAHFMSTDVNRAAFITAFNPRSTARSEIDNLQYHQALGDDLRALGASLIEGEGADPTGQWRPEASWLASGLEHDQACEIGRRYGQDAIVWIGSDAIPRLLLLR